jgi:predicted phage tail component-like protein
MLDIENIDYTDFYFNGKWLSSFNSKVAGVDGFTSFSMLPSKEIKTEKALGVDGEIVYSANFQPRTFTVPLYFEDISKIRDLSAWLSVQSPTDFYWKNDTVKIKTMPNELIDLKHYLMQGTSEIKFICHNPFFSLITETAMSLGEYEATFTNQGNINSYPLITITCSGDVTITVNGKSFTVTQVSSGTICIDSLYMSVYNGTDNLSYKFTGDFPILETGDNTLTVSTGTNGICSNVDILCRSRWI